jgi:hypothetical protein
MLNITLKESIKPICGYIFLSILLQ